MDNLLEIDLDDLDANSVVPTLPVPSYALEFFAPQWVTALFCRPKWIAEELQDGHPLCAVNEAIHMIEDILPPLEWLLDHAQPLGNARVRFCRHAYDADIARQKKQP